jgi:hypothetical protein
MRRSLVAVVALAVAMGLTGCAGRSTKASRDCIRVWNDPSNKARQSRVAGRFSVASVSEWRAEGGGGTVDLDGSASTGCGYLFHTARAYLSISGEWKGGSLRWGVPPSIRGPWSPQQQAAVDDNTAVDADGLLSRRQ